MATLNGEKICPDYTVYDLAYGAGVVTAVERDKIHVSFGVGRPRQYNSAGMTGKNCSRTLFHTCPVIIEFSRDECEATKKRVALNGVMDIFDGMSKVHCVPENDCPCD